MYLQDSYASTVIVENRVGAGGRIGTASVRNAAPDGTTLLVSAGSPITLYPHIYKKLPYGTQDFAPVARVASMAFGLAVGPAAPPSVVSLNDYRNWVKLDPVNARFGTGAAGSAAHFVGIQLAKLLDLPLEHIPFNGTAPLNQALMGGHLPLSIDALPGILPSVQGGRMRLLVTTGAQRSVPGVATVSESGFPKFIVEDFFGVFAPQRTSIEIINKAASLIQAALQSPRSIESLKTLSLVPAFKPAQAFALEVAAQHDGWGPAVKASGFSAEE